MSDSIYLAFGLLLMFGPMGVPPLVWLLRRGRRMHGPTMGLLIASSLLQAAAHVLVVFIKQSEAEKGNPDWIFLNLYHYALGIGGWIVAGMLLVIGSISSKDRSGAIEGPER